jgi:hypothetical protein
MRKVIIPTIILIVGYLFRNEEFIINIYDVYFLASYFTLSIYIVYCIIGNYIIKFLYKWIKNKIIIK